MTDPRQKDADHRLDAALERRQLEDPRQPLRARLRALKGSPDFAEHVRYYEEDLVPSVAEGARDPVAAWMEFGRRVAGSSGPGRELAVDPGGRAEPATEEAADDHLLLFVPEDGREPVLPLRVPRSPTAPQRATLDLLVAGRVRSSGA